MPPHGHGTVGSLFSWLFSPRGKDTGNELHGKTSGHKFHGGVHPPENKNISQERSIRSISPEGVLILPLNQHIGGNAEPIVNVGDKVTKGQKLARAQGYVSASVHAPASGRILAIDPAPTPHPSGLPQLAIHLEVLEDADSSEIGESAQSRGQEQTQKEKATPPFDYRALTPAQIRQKIRDAGLVGLGGAAFPTAVKLNPEQEQNLTLLLNGAECEPYITCDDRLMRERADEILTGAEIMMYALGANKCIIGIEENKPAAITAMRTSAKRLANTSVVVTPTIYPMGGQKQLTEFITGQQVPSGGHGLHVGLVGVNVGTAYAVKRAVLDSEPLTTRIVTITGAVKAPQNFEVPLGTRIDRLIALAGGATGPVDRVLMGGPMMGFTLHQLDLPVIKSTNAIIVMSPEMVTATGISSPCIRCAKCVDVCPASLMPHELHRFAKGKQFDKAQEYGVFDCIECGACSYVCPAHIPLVHYFRYAKQEIAHETRERKKAERARHRNEARTLRLKREKEEAEARRAAKLAAMKKSQQEAAEQKGEDGP